jgi:hypothetical protein
VTRGRDDRGLLVTDRDGTASLHEGAVLIITNNPAICRPLQVVVDGARCRAVVAAEV